MVVPVRVLMSLLSLSILILHACSFQEENVEGANKSNYKECIVKESGVIRRKMMLNCFKGSHEFATSSMKIQRGTRKLQEKNTPNVKDELQENVGNFVPEEKDVSGYVAFNADYRGPKRHPPKNN
ncbi:hypothetical protein LIER_12338 [Lithospermum erythrorhizon]|uniref:Uncharacterized protein n=1 Tax=Lithospermum erythrorhizon TaxID=34254 RepID=A0AAV3PTT2_LITER